MFGTRIRGHFSHYDQLGVLPSASPEEIRRAYLSLVRLLHPDQQTDPELKAAAERQLRKLNRIHDILTDPVQRRAYDDYLAEEGAPRPINAGEPNLRLRTNLIHGGWVVGAILTVAFLYWLGLEGSTVEPVVPMPGLQSNGKRTPLSKEAEIERLRGELAQAISERDSALREAASLRGRRPGPIASLLRLKRPSPPQENHPPASSTTEPPGAAPLATSAAPLSSPPPAVKHEANRTSTLGGSWFYVRPRDGQRNMNKALYPPEFIEMTITEQNGNIKGRYRGRYRIVDRPISPDVNFELSGAETGGACVCSWKGIGGARGQITLQATGINSMKIDWTAAELGTQQGLASGTAMLTRRPESP